MHRSVKAARNYTAVGHRIQGVMAAAGFASVGMFVIKPDTLKKTKKNKKNLTL